MLAYTFFLLTNRRKQTDRQLRAQTHTPRENKKERRCLFVYEIGFKIDYVLMSTYIYVSLHNTNGQLRRFENEIHDIQQQMTDDNNINLRCDSCDD